MNCLYPGNLQSRKGQNSMELGKIGKKMPLHGKFTGKIQELCGFPLLRILIRLFPKPMPSGLGTGEQRQSHVQTG